MKKSSFLENFPHLSLLDRRLTDEEKREIASAVDMTNWHFSLGLWIRNNWIYIGKYVEFFCEETTDGLRMAIEGVSFKFFSKIFCSLKIK